MTFLGIRCTDDTAEIVTDSASYLHGGTKFRETSKVATFPHLDAAFACYGNGQFSLASYLCARSATTDVSTFDDMVDTAPQWLADAVDKTTEMYDFLTSSTAVLVGRSDRESRFVAYQFTTSDDLTPRRIEGIYAHPMPFRRRPDQGQIDWLRTVLAEDATQDQVDEAEALLELWSTAPLPVVSDAADWIELARMAREDRSLSNRFARAWVAGSLYITRLRPGAVRTNRFHTFNDTGDELRRLVAGSRHPIAQISPCVCGSGDAALDCCLAAELDETCECVTGKTFGECCMVTDRTSVREQLWTRS